MHELQTLIDSASLPILTAYYATLGLLALYGVHRAVLVRLLYRDAVSVQTPEAPPQWPRVTVQLPLFNEIHVGPRLIEAVCRLDYPESLLEIQVLDDSTDGTTELLARQVEHYRALGFDIHHLRRADRIGFKAGALEAGQKVARGEFLAVFDADFVPPRDFLRRTMPHFQHDDVGMVQVRWEHLNRDHSLLTRLQAVLLDGHFVVEHAARARSGRFFNFNGTAGVWRRRTIEEAGGWQHDTLTEDLDLSYRAQLLGWRFVYLPEVVAPAELPSDLGAFKSQQRRWAQGAAQTCRKLLRPILTAPLPWPVRLEALVHLSNNFCYVLMVLLSVLVFPAMVARRGTESWKLLVIDLPLFLAATAAVTLFYAVSQYRIGRRGLRTLAALPTAMALGIGLSLNNGTAVLRGLRRMGGTFERTPKYRVEAAGGRDGLPRSSPYRSQSGMTRPVEWFFALYFATCFGVAIYLQMWWSLPFLWLFLHGYALIAVLGLTARGPRWDPRGTEDLALHHPA